MRYLFIILKWLALIPVSLVSSLLAWVVAPVAPLFVDRETWRLPKTLRWCSTPTTWLRGDRAHMAKYGDGGNPDDRSMNLRRWWQCVHWILRNPSTYFQRLGFIGIQAKPTDHYVVYGNPETRSETITGWMCGWLFTEGKPRAFHLYAIVLYPHFPGKGLRICLGWKMWLDGELPAQHTCRITPWKSFPNVKVKEHD